MTEQEIAELILDEFRKTNSKPNHIITGRWLTHDLSNRLNPKEKTLVASAISHLVELQYISEETRPPGYCLVLTDEGYDYLYSIDDDQAKEKIEEAILARFRAQNSSPNHVIQDRWVNQTLIPNLNPKERDFVNPAIENLITKGFIKVENRSGMNCLVLTDEGFDALY